MAAPARNASLPTATSVTISSQDTQSVPVPQPAPSSPTVSGLPQAVATDQALPCDNGASVSLTRPPQMATLHPVGESGAAGGTPTPLAATSSGAIPQPSGGAPHSGSESSSQPITAQIRSALKAGGDLNRVDANGWSLLMHAVQSRDIELVRELVNAGARVNYVSTAGDSAALVAVQLDDLEMLRALISLGIDVNQIGWGNFSLLMNAGLRGRGAIVIELMKHGARDKNVGMWPGPLPKTTVSAPVHAAAPRQNSGSASDAPMQAVANNAKTLIGKLVKPGDDVNGINADGATAIGTAALMNRPELVEALVAAGAKVDLADGGGQTALMIGAIFGSIASVKKLLELGASVNIADPNGDTALLLAASQRNRTVVEMLVRHGADISVKNAAGQKVLDILLANGDTATAQNLAALAMQAAKLAQASKTKQ